jgi:ABC-2 type transport system permease protein
VLVLGLVATLPIGAVTGALFKNMQSATRHVPQSWGWWRSPVFYPIAALPGWLRWVGHAFPIYGASIRTRAAHLIVWIAPSATESGNGPEKAGGSMGR